MSEKHLSKQGLAWCQRQSLLSHEEKMTGFNPWMQAHPAF